MGRVKQSRINARRARAQARAYGSHLFVPQANHDAELPLTALRRRAKELLARAEGKERRRRAD